jgi:hypothetical protein
MLHGFRYREGMRKPQRTRASTQNPGRYRRLALAALGCLALMCLNGCAGAANARALAAIERGEYASAVQTYRAAGSGRRLLGQIARALLLREAQADDAAHSRAAFSELTLLGTRARGMLAQLSRPEKPAALRGRALANAVALGDEVSRSQLRALAQNPDPDAADFALLALEMPRDWPELSSALQAPRAARRRAGLVVLSRSRDVALACGELTNLSAFDPLPELRAAALRPLAHCGPSAGAAIERALGDADLSVRVEALQALPRVMPERAALELDRPLGAALSIESLTAAAVLLHTSFASARAADTLSRGLSASEVWLRARAAVLVQTLPTAAIDRTALRSVLARERQPEVSLLLAIALGPADASAHAALVKLSRSGGIVAAQAARELAHLGDPAARARLHVLSGSHDPFVRASVARSLGREFGESESIAALLADPEWRVRLAAAGAVLVNTPSS